MTDHTLIDRAVEALHDPLPIEHLLVTLGLSPGSQAAREALDRLHDDRRVVALGDGRLASAARLTDGLVLWHRIDPVEASIRQVAFGLDLSIALPAVPDGDAMGVGDDVVPVLAWDGPGDPDIDRGPTVRLPEGWEPDLAAGDLVAVTVEGGRLRLHRDGDPALPTGPAAGPAEVAELGRVLERTAVAHGSRFRHLAVPDVDPAGQWLLEMVAMGRVVLADDAPVVRSLHRMPFREAVVRAGLATRGPVVVGPDASSEQVETYLVGRVVARGVCPDHPEVFEACGILNQVLGGTVPMGPCGDVEGGDVGDGGGGGLGIESVAGLLAEPFIAETMIAHLRKVHRWQAAEAEHRMRDVVAAHPGAPGPAFVHAVLLLRQGRAHDAVALLEEVVDGLDVGEMGRWMRPVRCLARLRMVAGDLPGAISLLRRVGDHLEAANLRQWLPRPPIVGRVGLLWEKVLVWSLAEECGWSIARAAMQVPIEPGCDECTNGLLALHDVHLMEGDGIGQVVDEVGALLPDDEKDLALRWRQERHRLWRVASDPDDGPPVWVDDVGGGRVAVVGLLDGGDTAPRLPVGTHVVAALVPGPAGHHLLGGTVTVREGGLSEARLVLDGMADAATVMGLLLRLDVDTPPDSHPHAA